MVTRRVESVGGGGGADEASGLIGWAHPALAGPAIHGDAGDSPREDIRLFTVEGVVAGWMVAGASVPG